MSTPFPSSNLKEALLENSDNPNRNPDSNTNLEDSESPVTVTDAHRSTTTYPNGHINGIHGPAALDTINEVTRGGNTNS